MKIKLKKGKAQGRKAGRKENNTMNGAAGPSRSFISVSICGAKRTLPSKFLASTKRIVVKTGYLQSFHGLRGQPGDRSPPDDATRSFPGSGVLSSGVVGRA